MKTELPIEHLLSWRLARAAAGAPRPPRGAFLLERIRPWWETWPERVHSLLERVGGIQVAYGHAMTAPVDPRGGYPVPALVVHAVEELETSAQVLYISIRDGRLRLRFRLDAAAGRAHGSFEATFVGETPARPLLSAPATLSVENEYRVDAEIPEDLVQAWDSVKVTDRMPFRLILHSSPEAT